MRRPLPRPLLAAAPAALLLAVAPARAAEPTILPGWWEYTTSALGKPSTDRRCIKASEIERFVSSPGTRHYRCTYPERSIAGGRAHYRGTCVSKHGARYPITLDGSYTPETLDLKGSAQPVSGLPVTIPATIHGRRLSATCPQAD